MAESEVNALFASCLPTLRKATKRMMRNVQDSEDALQDALLLAFRNLHQFEGRSSFSTWLHTIVRNSSLMHFRRQNSQRNAFVDLPPEKKDLLIEQGCPDTRPSPEDLCIQHERSDILRRMTGELPAKYHTAIRYFHLEGLGEEETARRLGMTPSALKAQLHRSRRILTCRIRAVYLPASRARPSNRETRCRPSAARTRRRKNQSVATRSATETRNALTCRG